MNPFLELAADFLLEVQERTHRVEELLLELHEVDTSPEERQALLATAKRELHTLKGNAGMMGLAELQELIHHLEDRVLALDLDNPELQPLLAGLDSLRSMAEGAFAGEENSTAEGDGAADAHRPEEHLLESVRVSFSDLDDLVDVLAEMVIFRNRLRDAVVKGRLCADREQAWDDVEEAEEALGGTLNMIQERIMSLRMVPLRSLFVSLKRIVHDVGVEQGKEIELHTAGGDTPMDKALLEVASEALGHMVRNAAIHGIEPVAERRRLGKPRLGSIHLSAVTEGNGVIIDVQDDGRGIDPEMLLAKATEAGIDTSEIDDPYSLLFEAGLSTHDGADLGAGRGIGLAAAMVAVRRLGGRIEVASSLTAGSCFRLHLPLSVSITRALLVEADEELYALPIANVEESQRFKPGTATEVNHALVMQWRGGVLPLVDIGFLFATRAAPRRQGSVVVIEAAGKRRGLLVDSMAGIREIVVKGLDPMVGSPAGVSGSTILGDGRVVLILDPTGLVSVSPSVAQEESSSFRERPAADGLHVGGAIP